MKRPFWRRVASWPVEDKVLPAGSATMIVNSSTWPPVILHTVLLCALFVSGEIFSAASALQEMLSSADYTAASSASWFCFPSLLGDRPCLWCRLPWRTSGVWTKPSKNWDWIVLMKSKSRTEVLGMGVGEGRRHRVSPLLFILGAMNEHIDSCSTLSFRRNDAIGEDSLHRAAETESASQ